MTVFKLAMNYRQIKVFRSLVALLATGLWKWLSIEALDEIGFTKHMFGYELIKDLGKMERAATEVEELRNSN